jgi:hypothetical protein
LFGEGKEREGRLEIEKKVAGLKKEEKQWGKNSTGSYLELAKSLDKWFQPPLFKYK